MTKEKWIQDALPSSSKGKLHRRLGVPQDKKIPDKKLNKAAHSKNPSLKKEANLAKTLKSFHHKGGGRGR